MAFNFTPNLFPARLEGEPWGVCPEFADHFTDADFSTSADVSKWVLVGSSAAATLSDTDPHCASLVSSTTNVASLQGNGLPFAPATGRRIIVLSRFKISSISTNTLAFVGLAGTADLSNGVMVYSSGAPDQIGVFLSSSTALRYTVAKNADNIPGSATTGETDDTTGLTMADDTFVTVAIEIIGTSMVKFFILNETTRVTTKIEIATNIPDDVGLTPVIEVKGSAGTKTLIADYFYATAVGL